MEVPTGKGIRNQFPPSTERSLAAMGFTTSGGWRAVVLMMLMMLGLFASQATGYGVAASDYAQALKEAERGRADAELLQIFRMGYEDIKDG